MFKVGDRVVDLQLMNQVPEDPKFFSGKIINIREKWCTILGDDESEFNEYSDSGVLVLEEVYNSPLYKAMKEE